MWLFSRNFASSVASFWPFNWQYLPTGIHIAKHLVAAVNVVLVWRQKFCSPVSSTLVFFSAFETSSGSLWYCVPINDCCRIKQEILLKSRMWSRTHMCVIFISKRWSSSCTEYTCNIQHLGVPLFWEWPKNGITALSGLVVIQLPADLSYYRHFLLLFCRRSWMKNDREKGRSHFFCVFPKVGMLWFQIFSYKCL